jgi:putative sigma-54 modulation protein
MRLDITGRQVEITPGIRQLITKSLAKIERILDHRAISGTVVLTKEKYRHITELIIHARGDHILSGVGEGNTWPLSVRKAAAKIENQAQKLKSKLAEGRHRQDRPRRRPAAAAPAPTGADGTSNSRVVRGRYPVKPMSIEDAAMRLDSGSDTFVVFRNADSESVSILYRRKDGNLGLIEPD